MVSLVIAAGCGGSSDEDAAQTPRPLVLERFSPPQPSSYDVLLAANDDVVVTANRYSQDGGTIWTPLDPRVGTLGRVELDGPTVLLYGASLGLARWNVAADELTPVTGAPSYAAERTWRRDRATGRFLAFDPVGDQVALERASGWTTAALPRPAPTECCAYITDVESNGSVLLSVSNWGVHRSTDDGASWQRVTAALPGAGRDLVVLGDGRFVLLGGATSYLFTASGATAGTAPLALGNDEATVCGDGALVAGGRITSDLGATWKPIASAGALEVIVERAACSGSATWVLLRSDAWGYRLVRFANRSDAGVAIGNWDVEGDQAWSSAGPSIVRIADGTFLAGGLAWREGGPWTLREMPAKTWSSGDALFGVVGDAYFTSDDAGLSWSAMAGAGLEASEPDAFARTADGALFVGQFTGESSSEVDSWRARVWRSSDRGATWAMASDGVATRPRDKDTTGEAHRFVGILADGTWVATDAYSTDAGATWTETETVGDRSIAHLMYDGALVTQPPEASGEIWRVYADGGRGPLLATHAIEADGQPVLAAELRSVAFDDAGYVYVARGAPHVQIWRSTTPLRLPLND